MKGQWGTMFFVGIFMKVRKCIKGAFIGHEFDFENTIFFIFFYTAIDSDTLHLPMIDIFIARPISDLNDKPRILHSSLKCRKMPTFLSTWEGVSPARSLCSLNTGHLILMSAPRIEF